MAVRNVIADAKRAIMGHYGLIECNDRQEVFYAFFPFLRVILSIIHGFGAKLYVQSNAARPGIAAWPERLSAIRFTTVYML
ncbi:MAG: hypothetical protein KC546_19150 [Anaerolineae bacterium]|nr:hypothetical protein [Anaerolineae bacterium]MCA9890510.1 hypothetical protein [Anaerolineae bacterium]